MEIDLLLSHLSDIFWKDKENGNIFLKKDEEFFNEGCTSPRPFKKIRLRSQSEVVFLDLHMVLHLSPFLKKLVSELKDCCFSPHDQVDICLDQFSPHLIHPLKNLLENGKCTLKSRPEQKQLDALIKALGLEQTNKQTNQQERLQLFNYVEKSLPTLHRGQEASMVDLTVSEDPDDSNKMDEGMESDPSPTEEHSRKRKLASDMIDTIKLKVRRCINCGQSFTTRKTHVCANSTFSLLYQQEEGRMGAGVKNNSKEWLENNPENEMDEDRSIENLEKEPARKQFVCEHCQEYVGPKCNYVAHIRKCNSSHEVNNPIKTQKVMKKCEAPIKNCPYCDKVYKMIGVGERSFKNHVESCQKRDLNETKEMPEDDETEAIPNTNSLIDSPSSQSDATSVEVERKKCPSCGKLYLVSGRGMTYDRHIEKCLGKITTNSEDNTSVDSLIPQNESGIESKMKECSSCGKMLTMKAYHQHFLKCVDNLAALETSEVDTSLDSSISQNEPSTEREKKACPSCGKMYLVSGRGMTYDRHIEKCLGKTTTKSEVNTSLDSVIQQNEPLFPQSESGKKKECFSCRKMITWAAYGNHYIKCLESLSETSEVNTSLESTIPQNEPSTEKEKKACPSCGKEYVVKGQGAVYDKHVLKCQEASLNATSDAKKNQNEHLDISQNEHGDIPQNEPSIGKEKKACPSCGKLYVAKGKGALYDKHVLKCQEPMVEGDLNVTLDADISQNEHGDIPQNEQSIGKEKKACPSCGKEYVVKGHGAVYDKHVLKCQGLIMKKDVNDTLDVSIPQNELSIEKEKKGKKECPICKGRYLEKGFGGRAIYDIHVAKCVQRHDESSENQVYDLSSFVEEENQTASKKETDECHKCGKSYKVVGKGSGKYALENHIQNCLVDPSDSYESKQKLVSICNDETEDALRCQKIFVGSKGYIEHGDCSREKIKTTCPHGCGKQFSYPGSLKKHSLNCLFSPLVKDARDSTGIPNFNVIIEDDKENEQKNKDGKHELSKSMETRMIDVVDEFDQPLGDQVCVNDLLISDHEMEDHEYLTGDWEKSHNEIVEYNVDYEKQKNTINEDDHEKEQNRELNDELPLCCIKDVRTIGKDASPQEEEESIFSQSSVHLNTPVKDDASPLKELSTSQNSISYQERLVEEDESEDEASPHKDPSTSQSGYSSSEQQVDLEARDNLPKNDNKSMRDKLFDSDEESDNE